MDIVSHILIGAFAGPIGILAQIAPDIPIVIASIYQLLTNKESISDIVRENHPKEADWFVEYCLQWCKVTHAWWQPLLVIICCLAIGMNFTITLIFTGFYALHLFIDTLTHYRQYPLYPFNDGYIQGLIDWSSLPLYKFLIWIPLSLILYFTR